MRRTLRPLLALLFSLLLVNGQQSALAHMLGHAAAGARAQAAADIAQGDDDGHDAALVLSHACTTCIAFAAADAGPAPSLAPLAMALGRTATPTVAVPPAPTIAFRTAFRSRAPPPL